MTGKNRKNSKKIGRNRKVNCLAGPAGLAVLQVVDICQDLQDMHDLHDLHDLHDSLPPAPCPPLRALCPVLCALFPVPLPAQGFQRLYEPVYQPALFRYYIC